MAQVSDFRYLEDFSDMNKDLGFAEGTLTQQRTNILAREGEIREAVFLGVGAEDYVNEQDQNAFIYRVKTKLELDNQTVASIKGTVENLFVDASYND